MTRRQVLIAIAVCVHVVMVGSILRQPLAADRVPGAPRYLGWRLHHDSTRMVGPGVDFFSVYHAGRSANVGISMYRMLEVGTNRPPYFFEYRYLPIVGQTLGRLLTTLPPLVAYRLWVLLVEALCLALAFMLRPGRPGGSAHLAAWLAYMLSTPFFLELHMGQFTFASAGIAVIGLIGIASAPALGPAAARWWASRAWLATGILLKLFPAALLVTLAKRRAQWGSLVLVVAALGAATVPGFVARPDDWYNFMDANAVVKPGVGNFGLQYVLLLTAQSFSSHWTLETWNVAIKTGVVVFVGTAALVVLLSRRNAMLAEGAVMLSALMLASYQIWEHHASAEVLAGLLLVVAIERDVAARSAAPGSDAADSRDRLCAWIAVGATILLALPTTYALIDPDPKLWSFADRMALQWTKPIGTLGIYVAGLAWLTRR